jgi:hypothetical protein
MAETGDEALLNRVAANEKDRNGSGSRLGSQRRLRPAARDDDRDAAAYRRILENIRELQYAV